MKIVRLSCDQCGAPLEAPARAQRFSCSYCGQQVAIDSSGPERPPRPPRMSQSESLRRRLQKVDDAWVQERARFVREGRDGFSHIPGLLGPIFGMGAASVFGIFFIGIALSIGAPIIFPIFGLFFIVAAIGGGAKSLSKGFRYKSRRQRFDDERRRLLDDD